jgi:hypothetical protein
MGQDCWKVIGGMGTAIVALCAAIVYLAKGWLGAVIARVSDRNDTIAQLNAAHQVVQKKKGESP